MNNKTKTPEKKREITVTFQSEITAFSFLLFLYRTSLLLSLQLPFDAPEDARNTTIKQFLMGEFMSTAVSANSPSICQSVMENP